MGARSGAGTGRTIGGRRSGRTGRDGDGSGRGSTVAPVSVAVLYRGRARLELLDLLAMGEVTHGDIARTLKCRVADIAAFAEEHDREIADIRAMLAHDIAIDSTAAGLWIASKRNRLAEIQSDIDDINDVLARMRNGGGMAFGSKEHTNLLRLKLAGLRAAAEEIDPPRRGAGRPGANDEADAPNVVHYVIEGDDDIIRSLT